MLKKTLRIFRNVGITVFIFFAIASCERDIQGIGIGLVNNNLFGVGDTAYEVVAYSFDVEKSRTDNNDPNKQPLYLFGVNRTSNFGYLKSSVISQVILPATEVDFGDNPIIDEVVLDMPYYSSFDSIQNAVDPDTGEIIYDEDGNPVRAPSYTLDSIYGNKDIPFQVRINELKTFMNILDPEDPTKRKKYYSDEEYLKGQELFFGDFKPNRNDTVLYVERRYIDGDPSTVDDIDTIVAENAAPSMKFKLDKQFFKTRFVDEQNSGYFNSLEEFMRYFKGLYIEPIGPDGSLMNFNSGTSRFTIYYTNEEIKDEKEDEDLNGNGITGEEGVLVRVKKEMHFNFGGIRTGKYERDYSGSLTQSFLANPNVIQGETKLFAQGAAGSEIHIKLFTPESLQDLRDKGWLLNEANLYLYIDKDNQSGPVPEQLLLYDYDKGIILDDLFETGSFVVFGGLLQRDEDDNPDHYMFRVTNYVSELLNNPDLNADFTLALKTYNPTDLPIFRLNDTLIKDFSYIPKGVVLEGNLPQTKDRRLKLKIYFSK
jgi:hypothetical protein